MIYIDTDMIFLEIEKNRPKSIVLNFPEGLLHSVQTIALSIEKRFRIPVILVGDTCYGVCDLVDRDTERLGADLAFHIGHNVTLSKLGRLTVSVDAHDDVSFEQVLTQALPTLNKFKRIGLCTISPHLHQLGKCRTYLETNGISAVIGKGKGLLADGQIFGCQFHSAYRIRGQVNAYLFLGQSLFHAVAVSMAMVKPTFMLDPYLKEVIDVLPLAKKEMQKALLSVYHALEAERFGLIIGLKEGQLFLKTATAIRKRIEELGKEVVTIALHEVTPERLAALSGIDAFIQTACPRISISGYVFNKPVLSIPQAAALIRILEGKGPRRFLQKSHWL